MPRGKGGKPKDGNAPKRPMSSYFLFSNERRSVLSKEQPDKKITELSKIISAEWKELAQSKKDAYQEIWKKKKAEYAIQLAEYQQTSDYAAFQRELAEWKQNNPDGVNKGSSKGGVVKLPKKPKDPNCPKRPITSYFLFGASVRPEIKAANPDLKVTEIAKLIGARWKTLSELDKKPFLDQNAALKAEYTEKMKEYKGSDAEREYQKKLADYNNRCNEIKAQATAQIARGGSKKTKKRRRDDTSSEEDMSSESGSESDSDSGSEESSSGSYESD